MTALKNISEANYFLSSVQIDKITIQDFYTKMGAQRLNKKTFRPFIQIFISFSPLFPPHRRRMVCPQWTAMSQHPASLPTTLPPKCHPTWGTAPPRRPMWPDPHGSRPVAVLYLPTAVTLQPLWPSRAWQQIVTPSTPSPPRCCEVTSTDWWEKEWGRKGG